MNKVTNLKHYMQKLTGRVGHSIARAGHLIHAEQEIIALLGPELARHVKLGNVRNGKLLLLADSGAWATRLRYLAPELLRRLRCEERYSRLQGIDVQIQSQQQGKQKPRHTSRPHLNPEAIKEAVNCVTDPELKAAFERLARHAREREDRERRR